MDVHRCRFVPYPPSAVNALAFSHVTDQRSRTPQDCLRLAVGRANGDIEIWNPSGGSWFQEKMVRGGEDRSIEGLVWTQDPCETDENGIRISGRLRLFSIGCSTEVTEWDLSAGTPARHASGNMGEIWCIAAQPQIRTVNNHSTSQYPHAEVCQQIAVGCSDGSIVLFSTADKDLQYRKVLSRPVNKKSRVLSIAYQHNHAVIGGYADSTIRVFDTNSNRTIRILSLGAGAPGGPKETLVWSLTCLADGSFVSGDSTGTVQIWDGKNYVMRQSIKSHTADVLTTSCSADGKTIFSGGMDRRTVLYRREGNPTKRETTFWKKVSHRRSHQHDVKAMAACEAYGLSVCVSGGLDTSLVVTPLRNFGKENHRTLSHLPQKPPICSAPSRSLLIAWWERSIYIWRLVNARNMSSKHYEKRETFEDTSPRNLVAKIKLKGSESISHIDITADGHTLFVASSAGLKAFHLGSIKDAKLRIRQMGLPKELTSKGTKFLTISPNQLWLAAVTNKNSVELFNLRRESKPYRIHVTPCKKALKSSQERSGAITSETAPLGLYPLDICQITFSANSRILAAGDLSGHLHSWVLKEEERPSNTFSDNEAESTASSSTGSESEDFVTYAASRQRWLPNPASHLLPQLPNAPLILSFQPASQHHRANEPDVAHMRNSTQRDSALRPATEDRLLVMTSAHELFEFNVLSGRLSDWSRRNPPSALPSDFKQIRDPAVGSLWDVNQRRRRVWIYGATWLWMFDLARDLPLAHKSNEVDGETRGVDGNFHGIKRKRTDHYSERNRKAGLFGKSGSGAGDLIRDHKSETGLRGGYVTITGTDQSPVQSMSLHGPTVQAAEDDEDIANQSLALLRRHARTPHTNDTLRLRGIESDAEKEDETALTSHPEHPKPPFWHTFKYRPILAIVPLTVDSPNDQRAGNDPRSATLEVALVERPLLDVTLPARYHGDQEWDEQAT